MSDLVEARPRSAGFAWRHTVPWVLAALLAAALPYAVPGGFGLSLLSRMGIAVVFALSFNMLLGQGGMLSFGHAVFLGFGGFLAMHAMRLAGNGVWLPMPLLPLVGAAGGLASALVAGWVSTRRAGTAFAMITLGVAELAITFVLMFPSVFGGEEGINGDRSSGPAFAGYDFGPPLQAYCIIAAWAFVCALLMFLYTKTPLGRLANAVRDNAERVDFLGYDPARIRWRVFALAGLFAGAAGGMAAFNDEIATSGIMSPEASGAVLLMTYIGGVGTFWGPVVGAVLITFLSVALSTITDAWQLYSGILFVGMVVWAPSGLSGIMLAHAPVLKNRRSGRLAGPYARLLPGALLVLAGIVVLAELGFRVQAMRNGAGIRPIAGLYLDPGSIFPWISGAMLVVLGVVWLRHFVPTARNAWLSAVGSHV